jgi:glycosyltransferase involved in cell wall biosynthesis
MNQPLVSTIIPTYDRPEKLGGAIKSVISQTYDNIEIVVVDDGSANEYVDNVVEDVSGSLPTQILRHNKNKGIPAARNTGVESANGEYIAFLDDDDVWKAKKIEKQVSVMQGEGRAVSYTWLDRVDENGNVTGRVTKTSSGVVRQEVPDGGFPGPPAVCIERDAILDVGGFDDSLTRMEDTEFGLRLADKYEYACVPETLVIADAGSSPTSKYVWEKRKGVREILEKHTPLPDRFGPNATERLRSRLYRGLGLSALKAGEYRIARRSLFQSIVDNPSQHKVYIHALAASGGPFTHKPAKFIKDNFFKRSV